MGSSCNCQRCLIGTVVLLTLAVVSLVAILVWRETRGDDKSEKRLTKALINRTYQMHFRTAEQQQFYFQKSMKGFQNRVLVNATIPSTEVCSFTCNESRETPYKQIKLAKSVYQGCCVSNVTSYSPPTRTNIFGNSKTFLQLNNFKQYFLLHACQSVSDCIGCVCAQESTLYTAVVLKPGVTKAEYIDDTEIDFFFFPGCCKCINN